MCWISKVRHGFAGLETRYLSEYNGQIIPNPLNSDQVIGIFLGDIKQNIIKNGFPLTWLFVELSSLFCFRPTIYSTLPRITEKANPVARMGVQGKIHRNHKLTSNSCSSRRNRVWKNHTGKMNYYNTIMNKITSYEFEYARKYHIN